MLNEGDKKHVMMVQRQKASPKRLEKIGLGFSNRRRRGKAKSIWARAWCERRSRGWNKKDTSTETTPQKAALCRTHGEPGGSDCAA